MLRLMVVATATLSIRVDTNELKYIKVLTLTVATATLSFNVFTLTAATATLMVDMLLLQYFVLALTVANGKLIVKC